MANEIELIVRGKDQATPALESVQDGLEGVGTSSKKGSEGTKGLGLSLTDLKSGVDLAVGAFNTFKTAAVAAFNFAQEGASLNQLSDSFASTGISIEALRTAARGTVDDASLMSSTLMLTAGSTGQVRDAFSAAAPQLLEMAKAAQKLNPELGDIPFLYNSIATAAKKVSPMIADNLGIIVKQSEANQKYADSIGVAVTTLTDEQKQLAYLNGLMEAGNVLLEQAGGSTASAADGYAVLTSELKNMTDAAKASADRALGPLISSFADMLVTTNDVREEYGYIRGTVAGFFDMLGGKNTLLDKHRDSMAAIAAGNKAAQQGFSDVGANLNIAADAASRAAEAQSALDEAQRNAAASAADASIAFSDSASALGEMSMAAFVNAQLGILKQAMDDGTISAQEFAKAQEALLIQSGMLSENEQNAQRAIDAITESFLGGRMSAGEMADAILNVKSQLNELESRDITIGVNWNVAPMPQLGGGRSEGGPMHELMAVGGIKTGSGWTIVGEEGPEMAWLPAGTQIMNARDTARARETAASGDGGVVIQVQATINNGMDAELWAARIGEIAGQRVRSRALGVM